MTTATDEIPSETQVVKTHRLRKAWQVSIRNWPQCPSSTFYASTQGKARYQAWLSAFDPFPDIRIVDFIVRRAPWLDIRLPVMDERAVTLSDEERHCLLHAYGANTVDPTTAGYRDYFYTRRDNPTLISLYHHGLVKPMEGDSFGEGMTYFVLTPAGKHVSLSLTPEYRTNG